MIFQATEDGILQVCLAPRAVLRDFCCLGSFCIQSLQSNLSSVIWDLHSYLILSIVRERVTSSYRSKENVQLKLDGGTHDESRISYLHCGAQLTMSRFIVYLPTRILVEL